MCYEWCGGCSLFSAKAEINEIAFSSLFRILEKPSSGNVDFKIFELFFASDFNIERPEMEKKFLCNEREGFLRSDTSSKPKRHKQHHQV